MRVLFLAHAFPPVESSGSLRSRGFSQYLPDFGVQPAIVCADPDLTFRFHVGATSRIADWQDDPRWLAVERLQWVENFDQFGLLAKTALRFPLLSTWVKHRSRAVKVEKLVAAGQKMIDRFAPDLIYSSAAPATTTLAGARLGQSNAIPHVIDLRDPWTYCPDGPYRHYLDFLLERRLERRTLATAAHILTPTRAARSLLIDKLGVSAEKVEIIENGYEPAPQCASQEPLEAGVCTFLHAGELITGATGNRRARGLKNALGIDYEPLRRDFANRSCWPVLRAFSQFLLRNHQLRQRFRLRLVGVDVAAVTAAASQAGCADRVIAESRKSMSEADELIARADVLLLLQVGYWLGQQPYCVAIPAKLYTYLHSGRPIIASAQRSEITELVESSGQGWCVEPGAERELSEALAAAGDLWLKNGTAKTTWSNAAVFSRKAATAKLSRVFTSIAGGAVRNDQRQGHCV